MNDLSEREKELLIIGIRMQLDDCEKLSHHHDVEIRDIIAGKRVELYALWQKVSLNS